MTTDPSGVNQLGQATPAPTSPEEAILERVPNSTPTLTALRDSQRARIHISLPVTGQPDFAHLVNDYVSDKWLVES